MVAIEVYLIFSISLVWMSEYFQGAPRARVVLIACRRSRATNPTPRSYKDFPILFLKYLSVQATELSTLIPLALGCKRLILVGDPRQLPATVKSQKAAR